MKKIIFSLFIIIGLVFVAGCSLFNSNKLICSGTDVEMGITENIEVIATFNNDIVDKVSAKITYNSENDQSKICQTLKSAYSVASSSDRISFTCSGKTIKIDDYAKMLQVSGNNVSNLTKDEFIQKMGQDGLTCK